MARRTLDFVPQPRDRGLATADARALTIETLASWDDFLTVADSVDLDKPTRKPRVSARAMIAAVGDWPEGRQLPEILADAQAGRTDPIDQDAINDRVVAAHGDASRPELLAAIERARDSVADWVSGQAEDLPAFHEYALTEVASPLGTLPLVTYAHAAAFQLALTARDLLPAGATVPPSLEVAGLRALLDTTGALAARLDIAGCMSAITPTIAVAISTLPQAWLTVQLKSRDARRVPSIEGEIGSLLDVAAGRSNPLGQLRQRKVRFRKLPELMRFAPIAHDVPGLPGGPVLRKAAGVLSVFSSATAHR